MRFICLLPFVLFCEDDRLSLPVRFLCTAIISLGELNIPSFGTLRKFWSNLALLLLVGFVILAYIFQPTGNRQPDKAY